LDVRNGDCSETGGVDKVRERIDSAAHRTFGVGRVLVGSAPLLRRSGAEWFHEPSHRDIGNVNVNVLVARCDTRIYFLRSQLECEQTFGDTKRYILLSF
jgi:hypothetical protein